MRGLGGAVGTSNSPSPIPLVFDLPLITVANDQIVLPMAFGADLVTGTPIYGYLQGLSAGTMVVTLSNDATTLFGTITWTAAGVGTVTTRNVSTINAGDKIHVNITGIGTAGLSCSVTMWVRVRP